MALFVSYASADQAIALEVCALLEAQGVSCWIAPRDVAPGAKWDEAIVDAIGSSSAFLLVLTEAANASQYVSNEVNHAFAANKPIFTFRAEDVQPGKSLGFYLARHHWTDGFIGRMDEQVAQLAAAIRGTPVRTPLSAGRSGRRIPRVAVPVLGLLALAASVSAATWFVTSRPDLPAAPVRFAVEPPPNRNFAGAANNGVAVAPDGRTVAFVAADQDNIPSIWLRPIDSLTAAPLDGTVRSRAPFWSPDGESVAFFAGSDLKVARRSGGVVRTIAEVSETAAGGTWRGDVIVFASGTPGGGLSRVDAGGGMPTPLVPASPGGGALAGPEFLPDGRSLVYYAPASRDLWLTTTDGGEPMRLREADSQAVYADGYLLFAFGGAIVAQEFDLRSRRLGAAHPLSEQPLKTEVSAVFSVAGNVLAFRPETTGARTQLRWVDRAGRVLGDIGEPAAYRNPALSPDDTRVAVERFDPIRRDWDIWIVDLARGFASRLTDAPGDERRPLWSRDGMHVVFAGALNGKAAIYRQRADGAGSAEVVIDAEAGPASSPWDVTPADELVVNLRPAGDTFVLAPLAGGPARPVARIGLLATVSPDGRSVVFNRSVADRWELFASPFPQGGSVTQVTADGGVRPRFTRDGRELVYLRLSDRRLVSLPVLGPMRFGAPVPLFDPRTLLDEAAIPSFFQQYDIARNGRFLLNVALDADPSTLAVVVNWRSLVLRD